MNMQSLRHAVVRAMNAVPAPIARVFTSHGRAAAIARPLVNSLMPGRPIPIVVRSGPAAGIRLLILPREEKFYWSGTHERAVQEAVVRALRPGMCFWDVGAHVGFFTFLASRCVGARGQVHAFEPLEAAQSRLRAAVELNSAMNVTLHPVAISSTSGTAALHHGAASTTSSLIAGRATPAATVVITQTLDGLLARLSAPAVVKIDAEGAEVAILGASSILLERCRPVVIVELGSPAEVEELHEQLGKTYSFEAVTETNWLLLPQ